MQATSYVVLACVCVCFFYAVGMFILSRMFCFALVLGTIDCVLLWGFCGEWWALRANLHANCFRFLPSWRWLRVHNPFLVAPQNLSDTRNSQVFFFFPEVGVQFCKEVNSLLGVREGKYDGIQLTIASSTNSRVFSARTRDCSVRLADENGFRRSLWHSVAYHSVVN